MKKCQLQGTWTELMVYFAQWTNTHFQGYFNLEHPEYTWIYLKKGRTPLTIELP